MKLPLKHVLVTGWLRLLTLDLLQAYHLALWWGALSGRIGGRAETETAIRTALEAAGVEFIPENGGGAGVRLRK